MKLWEQYIGNNYEKVDILKDSEDGIDMNTFHDKDDVLTLLIHLGYLG